MDCWSPMLVANARLHELDDDDGYSASTLATDVTGDPIARASDLHLTLCRKSPSQVTATCRRSTVNASTG